jgi:heme A synthase
VHVRPSRWRALPTLILVVGAILLGAVTARADAPHAHASAAASSSAAIR